MPHDVNGKVLAVGDKVTLEAEVTSITPSETACNCTVKINKLKGDVDSTITLNSKSVTKA